MYNIVQQSRIMISFNGTLNGIDKYNRIRIIVDDASIITKKINDIKNPYVIENGKLECWLIPTKYKEYYLFAAEAHRYKNVIVEATPKRYSFNGIQGTSLLLKSFELINI